MLRILSFLWKCYSLRWLPTGYVSFAHFLIYFKMPTVVHVSRAWNNVLFNWILLLLCSAPFSYKQYLFCNHLAEEESWLLYFNCVLAFIWLLVFYVSSSRYRWLVCDFVISWSYSHLNTLNCIVAKEEPPKGEANGPKLTVISRGKPMSPQTTQQRDSPKTVPARSLVPKEEPSTDF